MKRLLPVGLNVFGGRELDIVQQTKEKFLAKENEDKIREFVRSLLEIPVKVYFFSATIKKVRNENFSL